MATGNPEGIGMAVSLQLPTFWDKQPRVWFIQAEVQFANWNITSDDTKYNYLVKSLDQATATRLLDVLEDPPAEKKYESLKARLLSTFGLSRRARAAALLHIGPLGDRKPSELMDEMLALQGSSPPDPLFEQISLERMPEAIQLQLSGDTAFADPRAAAFLADKLMIPLGKPLDVSKVTTELTGQPRAQYCFYHAKFGSKAIKCRAPCNFQGNGPADRA